MPAAHVLEDEVVVDFGISGRHPLDWEIEACERRWEQDIDEIEAEEIAEAKASSMNPDDEEEEPDPDTTKKDDEDADEETFH